MIGTRHGRSAVADGWGCALCMTITNPASWWIPTKISSTATAAAPPHRFLPGVKGGLYSWKQAQAYPEVILVEGLFDYAVLWQAGFHNVTCSLGTHLNARQFRQLCDGTRTVYLAFDADRNGSGQQAAQCLSRSLRERGITACCVSLPDGHDPNSFFVQGGDARHFQSLLEAALP